MNHRQRQQGFTLIEVLIAVVVLSVGLLGVLALQVNTLAFSHSAYLTSAASVQAMDLEERIRVNSGVAEDYEEAIDNSNGDEPADNSTLSGYANDQEASACDKSTCTETQLVDADIARWAANTADLLPANATVALTNTGDSDDPVYELILQWQEPNRGQDDNLRTFRYYFRL
ncbi:type IV pilus modification protein PilV [Arhodomonas sp. SL1]|uniref:type IV pilus modification protein PilV n=1 Tax=Arhodomonas sp. SL1 TaxID=3425691 RepID=UPI003F885202